MVQSGVVWALTGCKWHIWVAEQRKKIFCFGRQQNAMAEGVEKVKPEKFEASKSGIMHSKGRANWKGCSSHNAPGSPWGVQVILCKSFEKEGCGWEHCLRKFS